MSRLFSLQSPAGVEAKSGSLRRAAPRTAAPASAARSAPGSCGCNAGPGSCACKSAGTPGARPFAFDFLRVRVHAPERGPTPAGVLQTKLAIGAPGDEHERQADRIAEQVLGMEAAPAERVHPAAAGVARLSPALSPTVAARSAAPAPPSVQQAIKTGGRALDADTRAYFEPRFQHDFGSVRVYDGEQAASSARAIHALAYAVGPNLVFRQGAFAPQTPAGKRLLAHELAHVVQQSAAAPAVVQRTLGDGHDLTSPRFSRMLDLEAAYDHERVIESGATGRGVQAIQQALYDLGFTTPQFGADGHFAAETVTAVKAFQTANGLTPDGRVGPATMGALDARFAAVALPAAAARAAPWTDACVRSIICPWSPHTVEVLRTRITLKSFDSISWNDLRWDGAAWVVDPFPGGGYNTGTEIGVLNSTCEEMAETLYHEVLHAEQPTSQTTTLAKESYAYRIGEEFSIAMGLGGRPGLRSTDAQGRQFADPATVGTFVAGTYPGVSTAAPGDEVVAQSGASDVQVRRPDGSTYVRPAVVGDKVPGPRHTVNEVAHPTAGWTC